MFEIHTIIAIQSSFDQVGTNTGIGILLGGIHVQHRFEHELPCLVKTILQEYFLSTLMKCSTTYTTYTQIVNKSSYNCNNNNNTTYTWLVKWVLPLILQMDENVMSPEEDSLKLSFPTCLWMIVVSVFLVVIHQKRIFSTTTNNQKKTPRRILRCDTIEQEHWSAFDKICLENEKVLTTGKLISQQ